MPPKRKRVQPENSGDLPAKHQKIGNVPLNNSMEVSKAQMSENITLY
jgi:hypothetical protein